jgi:hypothetical protein
MSFDEACVIFARALTAHNGVGAERVMMVDKGGLPFEGETQRTTDAAVESLG